MKEILASELEEGDLFYYTDTYAVVTKERWLVRIGLTSWEEFVQAKCILGPSFMKPGKLFCLALNRKVTVMEE